MATLPTIFVSHGAPTLALEDGHPWSKALEALGPRLGTPKAALVVSAHWQEPSALVASAAHHPETIHDFGGFADELYAIRYPAAGAPALAAEVSALLRAAGLPTATDAQRGLDHGAWVPMRRLFPRAQIPTLQLSLPYPATARDLFKVGEALSPLRDQGVLILASGGATHNLRRLRWGETGPGVEPYAAEFDAWLWDAVQRGDRTALEGWQSAPSARAAHPTSEHLEPLFVALGAARPGEKVEQIHHSFSLGALSLRSFRVGALPAA